MIAVGCPIYERAWILPTWLEHLRAWTDLVDMELVFVLTPGKDETYDIIDRIDWAPVHTYEMLSGSHSTKRNWGDKDRLETMVSLREALRREVAVIGPDFFLSLDSDILVTPPDLSPNNIIRLLGDMDDKYDAVAALTFLAPYGTDITNAFYMDKHVPRRVKVYGALQPADILCAAVLMSPDVYLQVPYEYDRLGEDIGWSRNAKEAGFKLGIDTGVQFKHVMSKEKLHVTDGRIGW